jgi:hypothetical protein
MLHRHGIDADGAEATPRRDLRGHCHALPLGPRRARRLRHGLVSARRGGEYPGFADGGFDQAHGASLVVN